MYAITFDQYRCVEWGLTVKEAALFYYICKMQEAISPQLFDSDGNQYVALRRSNVLSMMPFFFSMRIAVAYTYRKLQRKGLIKHIKEGEKDICWVTEKGATWSEGLLCN